MKRFCQYTEKTLVIGIDIGKEVQYARAFDYRGIELGKVQSFENTLKVLKHFKNGLNQ